MKRSLLTAVLLAGALGATSSTLPLAGPGHSGTADRPLYGKWRGLLPVAGGSAELTIDVTELPDGRRTALLAIPLQHLSQVPLAITLAADSVRFSSARPVLRFAGRWALGTTDRLEGTWSRAGASTPLTLERQNAPTAAAATPTYTSEEVRFANASVSAGAQASNGADGKEGLSLAGTLTRPAGKGPFPAVLLLSDQGAQDRDAVYDGYHFFAELADGLTKAGFVVLRFDDRGVGQSTGSLPNATAVELATDAQAGLNFLRARPDVDATRLGLLGHGQGANVALLTAAGLLPPSFVVAVAGYGVPVHEALVQQQTALVRSLGADEAQITATARRQNDLLTIIRNMTDQSVTQAIVANMLRQDSPGLDMATAQGNAAELLTIAYRSFLDFNPQTQLGDVKCPVLLLNGTADEQVNADLNLSALQKGLRNSRSVSTVKLSGVNHLLQADSQTWPIVAGQARPVVAPASVAALTTWLQRQTK